MKTVDACVRTVEEARALDATGVLTEAELRCALGDAWGVDLRRVDGGMQRLRFGAREKLRSGRTAELTPAERGYLLAAIEEDCPSSTRGAA